MRRSIVNLSLLVLLAGCGKEGFKAADGTLPSDPGTLAKPSYDWEIGHWSACSATLCGTQGIQNRSVVCKKNSNIVVADSFCGTKPASSQSCSAAACPVTTTTTQPPVTTTTLAPTTTTLPAPTTTTLPPSAGTAPITILASPSFKTVGLIITLPTGAPTNVSAKVFYKKSAESGYQEGHPFVRYDGMNMATSLFYLEHNTNYDVRVDYNNGSSITSKSTSFRTKLDTMSYPTALRTVNVSNMTALQTAVNNAQPGDHIVLASGIFSGRLTISGKAGTAVNPIVIRGANDFDQYNPASTSESARSIIDGNLNGRSVYITNSAHIIFDQLEVRNGGGPTNTGTKPYNFGQGFYLNSASNITIQNSYIHDNGQMNILSLGSSSYSAIGGVLNVGHHKIQNNFITDTTTPVNCPVNQWDGCSGITYEGIVFESSAGGENIIRKNRLTNHIDNMTICPDTDAAKTVSETTAHVLKQTSISGGQHLFYNTEVYENESYQSHDDDIEADGVCINLKVYDNILGSATKPGAHSLTIAPMAPGPAFFVRNLVRGYTGSAVKMNTGGSPSSFTRNVFFYHNTFVKNQNTGALLYLWYGGSTAVSVKDIYFKNNIFVAPNGAKCTNINTSNYGGKPGTILNYNLWYTPTTATNLYQWWDGIAIRNEANLSGFRTVSGQEANGMFANPSLNSSHRLNSTSPAINRGLRIPGINNQYNGAAPDIGAFEY